MGRDPFMRGAIDKLKRDNAAILLACGRGLQWLDTANAAKAVRLLGSHSDNMLAKDLDSQPGPLPNIVLQELQNMNRPFACYSNTNIGLPGPRQVDNQKLTGIASQDRLYIVGHGNPRGGGIVFKTQAPDVCGLPTCNLQRDSHKTMWVVDPTTLASLLHEDGLPLNHVTIDCVMCFSGGVKDEILQTVQPYAQRLAEALRARGYSKIRVAGAFGLTLGPSMTVRSEMTHDPDQGRYVLDMTRQDYEESLRWF